jgi:hypothetical protein
MPTPNHQSRRFLLRFMKDMDWAFKNRDNPRARPRSKRAEKMRKRIQENYPLFMTTYEAIAKTLSGLNADDLFARACLELVQERFGWRRRPCGEQPLAHVRRLPAERVARLTEKVAWN